MQEDSAVKTDAYAALKIKDFRYFLFARFVLSLAIQMQSAIVGWQVYSYTKDAFSIGLIGIAEAIPFIAVALFGGHFADILNRKKIIVYCDILYLISSVVLLLLTFKFSYLITSYGVITIYSIIFFTGIARGFIFPSQTALMAQIVPRELYANSSAWNSSMFHIAMVSGPAIGGLLIGFFGINVAYFAVVTLIFISLVLYLNVKSRPTPQKIKKESLFESLGSGIKFVFNNQVILGALSLDMFAVLFGGAVAMLPIFASEILKVGAEGFGFLRAAPAAGAVFMSLFLAHNPPMKNSGKKLLFCVAGFGLCIIVFAISRNFYLSLFLLALSGMFDNVSVIIRQTIIQLYSPDDMRGRIASVNSVFIGSSNEIGSFESGLAARLIGLIPSVIFGGTMTLIISVITAKIAPKLRNLNLNKA